MASGETEENKRIVRRYYDEVFAQHTLAALDELFASDFVGHSAAYGDYTLADMRDGIAHAQTDMPTDETIIEEQVAEGDYVVTRWRYRWQHNTPVFGEQPTGQWIAMDGVQIDRLAGGRIVERWEVKDFWGVVTRLGGTVTFPDSIPSPD
ncbi:MAG TPA: ester cyclase [Ktedonobacterales bacterium]|nr:ester cyclase [Ktedonobacterales bacterium]